ncbi:sodium/potassium-transporting ATPase subunit beta-1-interacting protein 3 [Trichinella spiralis]|uniref:Enteropeptidase n=1 Tax=Trichinella spiralis TaxID=6334 RepID=E5SUQ1_TRISP|nr:sodium/potassium-transporting ATPase subunit beta-1-interacting protein 3 [Trichinella spiralis]KRY26844.1 Enteropeptidase [Trichinella spiralis]
MSIHMFTSVVTCFILFVGTNGWKCGGKDPSLEHAAKDYLSRGNSELNFPWTVLIERNILGFKSVRCLGSLIPSGNDNQTNLVVTSANCFWSKLLGMYISKDYYSVVAGVDKSYSQFTKVQHVPILKITVIPVPAYDSANNRGFAVLHLKKPVMFTEKSYPPCLPRRSVSDASIRNKRCSLPIFRKDSTISRQIIRVLSTAECEWLLEGNFYDLLQYCGIGSTEKNLLKLGSPLVCLEDTSWVLYGIYSSLPSFSKLHQYYENNILLNFQNLIGFKYTKKGYEFSIEGRDDSEETLDEDSATDKNANVKEDEQISTEFFDQWKPNNKKQEEQETEINPGSSHEMMLSSAESQGVDEVTLLLPQEKGNETEDYTLNISTMNNLSEINVEADEEIEESEEIEVTETESCVNEVFKHVKETDDGNFIHKAPWMVFIVDRTDPKPKIACSGSLLKTLSSNHSDVILSAAQCVWSKSVSRFGVLAHKSLSSESYTSDSKFEYRTLKKILTRPMLANHDQKLMVLGVSILKLDKPFVFKKSLSPVSAITEKYSLQETDSCYASGLDINGNAAQYQIKILTDEECKRITLNEFYEGSEMCVADQKAIQLPTGSPLMCQYNGNWYLYGIFMTKLQKAKSDGLASKLGNEEAGISVYLKLIDNLRFMNNSIRTLSQV